MLIRQKLEEWPIEKSVVLLRSDCNVTFYDDQTFNDFRLRKACQTIDYLRARSARIILISHLSAHGENRSLATLVDWFSQRNYQPTFATTIEQAGQLLERGASFIILENIRLLLRSDTTSALINKLASYADYYVNDALSVSHRSEPSIVDLPLLFPLERKSCGLFFAQELALLDRLKNKAEHPICFVIGGGKMKDKIALLAQLTDYIDTLLLCPALVFSFLSAMGKSIGKSVTDPLAIDAARAMLHSLGKITLYFPQDYLASYGSKDEIIYYPHNELEAAMRGINIGKKTVNDYEKKIAEAKTIFFNGPAGFINNMETTKPTAQLFKAISAHAGQCFVAGGDSIAYLEKLYPQHHITNLISSGGAALWYLTGQLPGITALMA